MSWLEATRLACMQSAQGFLLGRGTPGALHLADAPGLVSSNSTTVLTHVLLHMSAQSLSKCPCQGRNAIGSALAETASATAVVPPGYSADWPAHLSVLRSCMLVRPDTSALGV